MTELQDLKEPFMNDSTIRLRALHARVPIAPVSLFAMLTLGAGDALAQQTAVCNDTPATGERIECTEAADSTNGITVTPTGIDIDTMEDDASGVYGHHEGTGRIFIDLQTGSDGAGGLIRNDIDTMGDGASGVSGRHEGSGNIEFGAQNAQITTAGERAHGFYGYLGYRPASPPTHP